MRHALENAKTSTYQEHELDNAADNLEEEAPREREGEKQDAGKHGESSDEQERRHMRHLLLQITAPPEIQSKRLCQGRHQQDRPSHCGNKAVAAPDGSVVVGALCGLSTAAALGLNFVMFRARPTIPLLLANGMGAFTTGLIGLSVLNGSVVSLSILFEGNLAAISVSGLLILPLSFVALTAATRFTRAANVSLFMLLESVLGPVWVWLGTGERPGSLTIFGGVIVIVSLAVYIRLLLEEEDS